jgi:hypothetical protein
MMALSRKTVFAILMGAMFAFAIILAIEFKKSLSFGWMVGGFFGAFGVAFVFLYVRAAPVVIAGTILLVLGGYLLWKFGDAGTGKSVAIGAMAGLLIVILLQFGWVKPHMDTMTGASDYHKQQQAIYEQEKKGGLSYAEQQKALYEEEKARKAQGGAPPQGGPPGQG